MMSIPRTHVALCTEERRLWDFLHDYGHLLPEIAIWEIKKEINALVEEKKKLLDKNGVVKNG